MNKAAKKPLSDASVEKMLRSKAIASTNVPCAALESLALTLSGNATSDQRSEANRHLEQCETCREALLLHSEMTAQGTLYPLIQSRDARYTFKAAEASRFLPKLFAVAASLAAVIIGLLFFRSFGTKESSNGAMVTKGYSDELYVAVHRGDVDFVLKPNDTLMTGDSIGLFYSSNRAGYLAVFNLDSMGEAALIYPASKDKSAGIKQAKKAPLPDGAVVQDGKGCEWLIGIFSEHEFDLHQMEKTVESGTMNRRECNLKLEISDARSVRIVPFAR